MRVVHSAPQGKKVTFSQQPAKGSRRKAVPIAIGYLPKTQLFLSTNAYAQLQSHGYSASSNRYTAM